MAHYINFFGANSRDLRRHVDYHSSGAVAWLDTAPLSDQQRYRSTFICLTSSYPPTDFA